MHLISWCHKSTAKIELMDPIFLMYELFQGIIEISGSVFKLVLRFRFIEAPDLWCEECILEKSGSVYFHSLAWIIVQIVRLSKSNGRLKSHILQGFSFKLTCNCRYPVFYEIIDNTNSMETHCCICGPITSKLTGHLLIRKLLVSYI